MEELLESSVLIVDDSKINLRMVSKMITSFGYKVHTADNGYAALKTLTKVTPSIILMDVQMPNMDGFDCCRRIKKSAVRAKIPVIFMSCSSDASDKKTADELGAKDFLIKPLEPEVLKKSIDFNMPWSDAESGAESESRVEPESK